MRKGTFAERFAEALLAQSIGAERAAAVYGDLAEMAATRGRVWFWRAWLKAAVSLCWRTGFWAFTLAMMVADIVFSDILPWAESHLRHHLNSRGLFGEHPTSLNAALWNVALVVAQFLFFAVPFLLIRFGWRDRMTRLACLLLAVSVPAYSMTASVMDLAGAATAVVLAASFLSRRWRRPAVLLSLSWLSAALVMVACTAVLYGLLHPAFRTLVRLQKWPEEYLAFGLAAIVCLRLNRGKRCKAANAA